MLLELVNKLGHGRTLKVQVHVGRLTLLLKHRKGTNLRQKDTHQEIIQVLALRGTLNPLDLTGDLFVRPTRNTGQQVLERPQCVFDLAIPLTELTCGVLQAPQAIRDLRNENLTQMVLQVHLDELSRRHLFMSWKPNGAS
jgi:hypothetical protein